MICFRSVFLLLSSFFFLSSFSFLFLSFFFFPFRHLLTLPGTSRDWNRQAGRGCPAERWYCHHGLDRRPRACHPRGVLPRILRRFGKTAYKREKGEEKEKKKKGA